MDSPSQRESGYPLDERTALPMLAAIVQSSDDAIVSKDLDGVITSWNPGATRIFGWEAGEVVGRSIRLIIPPDRQHEEDEVLRRIRAGERVDHFETERMHKDGSRLQISVTISPIRDSTGTIIGASKVARDISQRIAAEEAMRKSRELKDDFLSLVSHELRTPIAVVVGNGNMLLTRERALAPDDRRRAIEDIAYQGERLQRAIENVLLLTRIEAGERVKIGPIDLSAVTEQAIRELRPLHARQIDVDVSAETRTVRGNAALLFLVIENLISNADKFSEAGAKVDVCVRDDGIGFGEVHVCDRGPGLTHADLERVFDPFFRSDRYASRSTGLGLGLAVCKRAIEHQGGRISADQRPGGGLDFWFTLPYWVTPGAQP